MEKRRRERNLPMIRKPGFRIAVLVGGLAVALSLVALLTAVEVSSQPQFCGSCHIMTPYYESWKASKHHNIACVECHIAPGVTAEIRKKYEALSMVTSYFTGTYGTNPWTEVDDAACLKCHERRLLAGKELFGDVLFDHTKHLAGMRRGKTLRCTSCHSQIVQGSHIAVTTTTCILCHFKGQPADTGTARCTLCHLVPDKVIQHGTLTFNHGDVERFGMACSSCHARPEGSDGQVPRERCVTCHNDADRLEKYSDTELLHHMHVSEHKIDCMDCHLEIQHVGTPRIEAAATGCGTCHMKGHTPQLSLYTGVGGKGVKPMPSPMFLAGIRCEGCHLEIPGQSPGTRSASAISCMSCHGPTYGGVYDAWMAETGRRTSAMERAMAQTTAALGSSRPRALEDARFNLDLVREGGGVHNVDYAFALLARAHEDLNAARTAGRLEPLPKPWREIPYQSPCLTCHQGIDTQRGTIFGRTFSHERHVIGSKLDCAACHRPHAERAAHEVVMFDAAGCESCHHKEPLEDCISCHGGIRNRNFTTPRGEFSHTLHLDEAGQTCMDCHEVKKNAPVTLKEEHCADCHG